MAAWYTLSLFLSKIALTVSFWTLILVWINDTKWRGNALTFWGDIPLLSIIHGTSTQQSFGRLGIKLFLLENMINKI